MMLGLCMHGNCLKKLCLMYFSLTTCLLFVCQKRDFREETDSVLSTVRGLLDDYALPEGNTDTSIQVRYTDSLTFTEAFTFYNECQPTHDA